MSSGNEIDILTSLKNQLVSFFDELIESFPQEPDFVIFRIFVKDQIPIYDIMKYIVANLCPLQEMVKTKNENFFLNHNILFEKLNKDTNKISYFKKLWTSGKLDKEDKAVIWQWFETFISLGNRFNELEKRKKNN